MNSQNLPDLETFRSLSRQRGPTLIPLYRRLFADQLTPVLAYRRLTGGRDRQAGPSFLLESVVGGERLARYSYLGAQPVAEVLAYGHEVTYRDHRHPENNAAYNCDDPLAELARLSNHAQLADVPGLPDFTGGWVGHAGYDTVRYLEGEKLPHPPPDDRHLPDLHMQLYYDLVAFDHVQNTLLLITHIPAEEYDSPEAAYEAGHARLNELADRLTRPLPAEHEQPGDHAGRHVDLASPPPSLPVSNMGEGGYQKAVEIAKRYVAAGDIFQVVPSQRFELQSRATPFEIYRALRVVNPSPYMFFLQIEGATLVGSSPEILCRVHGREVVSRPLAGTRRRGKTPAEDEALEKELLADPKDRAEHIMLVDLGRNDVGRVAQPGTIELPEVLTIERYSHVMHISSTVTGRLRDGLTAWDALRVTLPVGTVSGAPKIRAMQIIDELEPTRRGPYAGAVGYADFLGNMDMAIALRTMVILPPAENSEFRMQNSESEIDQKSEIRNQKSPPWRVHIQAGGGIVADSDPDAEHQETVNKAAALAKAVELAER